SYLFSAHSPAAIRTLSLHDALPISPAEDQGRPAVGGLFHLFQQGGDFGRYDADSQLDRPFPALFFISGSYTSPFFIIKKGDIDGPRHGRIRKLTGGTDVHPTKMGIVERFFNGYVPYHPVCLRSCCSASFSVPS